ncbi:MAG TPA: thiamine diphosphokinase [Deltaproteobacteria bacterium]|nr:thiamine diphosphokinase [Deltaproteobacteria bacterium]HPR54608.1 thiamine diphosphokinase [Deltaproteobacteria bacterium]HXK47260.1 thiamine diphosphokinase [Deltaproteobacteria bacterium]
MFLIVTGGEPPSRGLLLAKASDAAWIVAADRGAGYCLDAGITPHLVVGDMDSLDDGAYRRLAASGVEIMQFDTRKDRTDTEIALDEAVGRGARHVEILGATGDRLDHTLANVHLLYAALRHGVSAHIVTDSQQVFLVDSRAVLEHCQGCTVSFLPLTGEVRGVVLEGFAYELSDATMEIGRPCGVSNVVRDPRAGITVREGVLLAVLFVDAYREEARVVTGAEVDAIVDHEE